MKKLVLCVDRDDDLGSKAGINTPLMSREAVLQAAIDLGITDPEDSDTNTLLAAVNLYDSLTSKSEQAGIACICGDSSLGFKADEAMSTQLDIVLEHFKPEGVILVSDGSEDESFYPIISSRVKVISLRRVFVKQAPDIERAVHIFLKTLDEEKIKKRVFIPLALALIVYGIFALSGYITMGIGAIAVTLGIYFFIHAYKLEESLRVFLSDIHMGLTTSRISLPFSVIAGVIALGGGIFGWGAVQGLDMAAITILELISLFIHSAIWWFVISGMVYGFGQVIDNYIKERRLTWTFVSYVLSLVAMGLIIQGSFYLFEIFIAYDPAIPLDLDLLQLTFFYLVLGITIGILGGYVHHYIREREESRKVREKASAVEVQK